MITIRTDLGGVDKALEALIAADLPFIVAKTLTQLAQLGQAAAREEESNVFDMRNDWTMRNTKIVPAKKDSLVSEVYTDTGSHSGGAPDYLPPQQSGGDKVPHAGHTHVAVPTKYLLAIIGHGIIPDALRPKHLLPADAVIGQAYIGSFRTPGVRPRKGIGKDARKSLGSNEFVAFKQKAKSGVPCIFVRRGSKRDAEPWYVLIPEAHIKARFPMERVVEEIVRANTNEIFTRVANEVMVGKVAKMLGSGSPVTF